MRASGVARFVTCGATASRRARRGGPVGERPPVAFTLSTESRGPEPDTSGGIFWPTRPRGHLVHSGRIIDSPRGRRRDPLMASPDGQSVTRLIRAAQQDRASAAGPLLAVYFDRLVRLARSRLQGLPGLANDDEDLALRSFYSVYRR